MLKIKMYIKKTKNKTKMESNQEKKKIHLSLKVEYNLLRRQIYSTGVCFEIIVMLFIYLFNPEDFFF